MAARVKPAHDDSTSTGKLWWPRPDLGRIIDLVPRRRSASMAVPGRVRPSPFV